MLNKNPSKLSIVIPCYNAKNYIIKLLEKIHSVKLPLEKEIIIVDDFSTDGTREIIAKLETPSQNIKIIFNKKNKGKGYSLRQGFAHVTGDIIIIQDSDLEYDPFEYVSLIQPILDHKAEIVFGSRFLDKHKNNFFLGSHYYGNKFLTFVSNLFTGLKLTDMETCYKVFYREILDRIELKEDGFGFEPEFTAKISKIKCNVTELPITYRGRTFLEGKNANWKVGIKSLYAILKYGLKN